MGLKSSHLGCLVRLSFEITQETLKGELVGIMIFPSGEVADVPAAAQVGGPVLVRVQNCIVQSQGKEYIAVLAFLFFAGGKYLALDPGAGDSGLGEYDDEFIVEANGFVDTPMIMVADLEIFFSEPAAHASGLEIGIEALSKVFILVRVGNEAGVIIDGQHRGDERAHIGDEGFRNAHTAQKSFRDLSVRLVDSIEANGRRKNVLDCSESAYSTKI